MKYTDTHGHAKSPHSATENESEDKHLTRESERNKDVSKTDSRKRMVEKLKNVRNSGEK